MADKNDGGPAFACAAENGLQSGMSLRDYFAGQAIVGHIASFSGPELTLPPADVVASYGYAVADAMLAERAKHQTVDVPFRLESGKRYITADGQETSPLEPYGAGEFIGDIIGGCKLTGHTQHSWKSDGTQQGTGRGHCDLVKVKS